MSKVIYEPHPVHPARKAKLQAQGYRIIDAIFAPAGTPLHQLLDEPAAAQEPVQKLVQEEAIEEIIADAPVKRPRSKKA